MKDRDARGANIFMAEENEQDALVQGQRRNASVAAPAQQLSWVRNHMQMRRALFFLGICLVSFVLVVALGTAWNLRMINGLRTTIHADEGGEDDDDSDGTSIGEKMQGYSAQTTSFADAQEQSIFDMVPGSGDDDMDSIRNTYEPDLNDSCNPQKVWELGPGSPTFEKRMANCGLGYNYLNSSAITTPIKVVLFGNIMTKLHALTGCPSNGPKHVRLFDIFT